MEVEPTGDAIDVESLSGEVKAGDKAAFHGFKIYLGEWDASASDEFLLVHALAADGELGGG